jgi:fumarate hydratase subunit beta
LSGLLQKIHTSELMERASGLRAGTPVLLSGVVYTARDAAHRRFFSMLDRGEPLPFDLKGAAIYYAGPTPAKPGTECGSCGPTTSGRMDAFAPRLLRLGLSAMIGKGGRSLEVADAIRETGSVYFCAVGGAGALMAGCVLSLEEIAFPELGCESVKKLTVCDMPLITAIDSAGGNLFIEGPRLFANRIE